MRQILIYLSVIVSFALLNASQDKIADSSCKSIMTGGKSQSTLNQIPIDTFKVDTTEMIFDASTAGTWKPISFKAVDEEGNIKTEYSDTVTLTLNNSEASEYQVVWADGTAGELVSQTEDTGLTTDAYFGDGGLNLKLYHEFADSGLSITLSDEERNISITTSEFGFKPDIVDSMLIKIPDKTIYAGVEYEYEIIPVDTFGNINYEDVIHFYFTAKQINFMNLGMSTYYLLGPTKYAIMASESIDEQWVGYFGAERETEDRYFKKLANPSGRSEIFEIKPPDYDPPLFTEFLPADDDSVEPGKTNIQFVAYDSISGIKPSSLIMTFEGDTVIPNCEDGIFKYETDYLEKGNYTYTVELEDSVGNVGRDTVTFIVSDLSGIKDVNNSIPKSFFLGQNYPNPFNPTTTIKYGIPERSKVKISIYNINGKRIKTLTNKSYETGYYEVKWDASDFASGIYFYKINADDITKVKKCVLMK